MAKNTIPAVYRSGYKNGYKDVVEHLTEILYDYVNNYDESTANVLEDITGICELLEKELHNE